MANTCETLSGGECGCGNSICDMNITGRPRLLSVYAPVVYDEIGVNVCRRITIPEEILEANPTASCAQLDVIDVTLTEGSEDIPQTEVLTNARANCTTIILTNVEVTFRIKLFDNGNHFLTSTVVTANYLPGSTDSPDYEFFDNDINPESVTLELYTPYGIGYTDIFGEPVINTVGFLPDGNTVTNGINIAVVAKAMDFNRVSGTFSAGISLFVRTVYYETYKVAHEGKPVPPKVRLDDAEMNSGLKFVESGLLSREIKPLELEPPKCEGNLKKTESPCERDDGTKIVSNKCLTDNERQSSNVLMANESKTDWTDGEQM